MRRPRRRATAQPFAKPFPNLRREILELFSPPFTQLVANAQDLSPSAKIALVTEIIATCLPMTCAQALELDLGQDCQDVLIDYIIASGDLEAAFTAYLDGRNLIPVARQRLRAMIMVSGDTAAHSALLCYETGLWHR